MPIIPFGDYRPDVTDYDQSSTGAVLNALPRGDGYGPFSAFAAYSAALAGPCRGFFKAIKTDGSIAIFAATATRLYQLNNTNQTWTDVSKGGSGGSGYSAVSSTDQWQFVQFINYVIAVQANAPPQFFDLTGATQFADLGGSPPQARYAAVVGSFVVLSGLVNNPYRVQWSALGDPTGWTAGVNSSSFQDLPDGGVVRGVAGGEFGNIFQDTAIRRLVYAPGSPVIFQIERISDDRGLYAPYSLIRSGDQIFFLGPQGFQQMDPAGYPAPIGKEKVNRTFLADLDTGNLQLVIGASDPRNNRVFWTDGTWLDLIGRHRPELGFRRSEKQLLALKFDPDLNWQMTRAYAEDNAKGLNRARLPITPARLYLMHFLSPGDAPKLLHALPDAPAASIVSEKTLKNEDNAKIILPRTAAQMLEWASRKMGMPPESW